MIADNFFQAAFGGSFLNHQYLIAAQAPSDPNAPATQHSLVDSAGFPRNSYPLYKPLAGATYQDSDFTVTCPAPLPTLACGNYAVNTMQPSNEPSGTFGDKLVAQTNPTIGDRLSAKGIDWAWYAGGWATRPATQRSRLDERAGPDLLGPEPRPGGEFIYPNARTTSSSTTTSRSTTTRTTRPARPAARTCRTRPSSSSCPRRRSRARLRVEAGLLLEAARRGERASGLREHPERRATSSSSVLQSSRASGCAKDTMVIVTYDEFGGQWDHVPPPGQGSANGPHDLFGPGTRIPALIIAPGLKASFSVDSTEHDTTSILATIEHASGSRRSRRVTPR